MLLLAGDRIPVLDTITHPSLTLTFLDQNGCHLGLLSKNVSSIHLIFKEQPDILFFKQACDCR